MSLYRALPLFFFSLTLLNAEKPPVTFIADVTYLSQYIGHGFDLSNGSPVVQGTVLANHVGIQNLELAYMYSYTLERGDRLWDETGPAVRYTNVLFSEETYAVKGVFFAYYFNYPNWQATVDKNGNAMESTRLQGLKLQSAFSLPNLWEIGSWSVVPSYSLTNWQSVKKDLIQGGSQHEFGLTASTPVSFWKLQSASVRGTANYHDGLLGIKEGWTHYTLQADTLLEWQGLYIKPGLNYQWSLEPTMNAEDEFWFSLSVTKVF
ncbi:MAG: hypothetical protein ACSHYA_03120 [Opitutaceae bacterium]